MDPDGGMEEAGARSWGWASKARFVILGGVCLSLLLVAASGLLLWKGRRSEIREWQGNAGVLSTMVAAHAEQTVTAAGLVLESLAVMVENAHPRDSADLRRLMSGEAVFTALHEKISGVPQVSVATLVDGSGVVVNFSRQYPTPPINLADRDYFMAVMDRGQSGVYLSAPVPNRGSGEWTFYLAQRISDPAGRPIGAVLVGIGSQFFQEFYKAANLGPDITISLLRTDGVLLAREPQADAMIGRVQTELLRRSGRGGDAAGSVERVGGDGGTFRILAPRRLRDFPLMTTLTVSEDAVLADWRDTVRSIGALTLLVLLILLGMTFVIARLFGRQAETLTELDQARRRAEGSALATSELFETLKASEARLLEKSKVLELTLDNIDQGLLMVAADRTLPVLNRRAMDLLGLPDGLVTPGFRFDDLVDYQRGTGEFVNSKPRSRHSVGDGVMMTEAQVYERTRPNGRLLEVQTIPLPEGGMVRTFTDITERRKSEEQVRYFAHHDGLTQLVNRVVFLESLDHAISLADKSSRSIAVLYLDLDGFKGVNDTHGHAVGDKLLIEVSRRLKRVVRDIDTVARMGGDEFAIIQPLVERRGSSELLARRALTVIAEPYVLGEVRCTVGVSIGIALYPDHAQNAEDLLRGADIALYRAKGGGRGASCMFDEFMDRRQQALFQLEQELGQALPEAQFVLEYQPIVDSRTRRPERMEALLRWRHPVRGVVGPGDFIGVAERSGLIVPVGLWVLETACAAAVGWPEDVEVAVNLSPVQFTRGDLPAQVMLVLQKTGLAPGRLNLEVTEGVLLEDTNVVLDAMSRLRALGVRFSLDDFGTAHAGLTYLRRFPFDMIKIDQSFTLDVVAEEEAQAIVAAILAIGAAFRLTVIAEGVETEAQLAKLVEMGCSRVQGYLTGRPAALEALSFGAGVLAL